jgi:putative FmdB family regulatory protein
MPIYEFRCKNCQRRFDKRLSYQEYGSVEIHCVHCGSSDIQRRISRVRVARSDESRLESLADPAALANIDNDPRALGRMMREMGSEVGEEMGPEFDEVIHRLESGQSPEQIERDMPDVGGPEAPGAADFGGLED